MFANIVSGDILEGENCDELLLMRQMGGNLVCTSRSSVISLPILSYSTRLVQVELM